MWRSAKLADVSLTLVTPEDAPLGIFGQEAAATVVGLLAENWIGLQTGRHSVSFENGILHLGPDGVVEADRVVTLPRLAGTQIDGIPQTADLFVWTDAYGRVLDLADVYAAGDITAFPVKQGGIAADQALAAAQHIAASAGAPVEPKPFDPILHGLLLTGSTPRFFRAPLAGGHGEQAEAASEPLGGRRARSAVTTCRVTLPGARAACNERAHTDASAWRAGRSLRARR